QELLALHPARTGWTGSSATLGGLYEFPPGQDVTIVCAPVPQELLDAMPYANPDDPDHIELYRYADLDALFELQGHVRAANPASRVVAHLSTELTRDDYTAHLVVLGGVDWNELTRLLLQEEVRTSVQQIPSAQDPQGSGFLVVDQGGSCTFRPRLRGGRLVEDVAYVLRAPNPYNHLMTLTMCNGIYGRGTYGAVRALTDTRFRDQNEQYLRQRFPGASTFGLLTRVHIVGGKAVTPDWTQADMRLHEWSVE
ncbi:MAG TPA: XRE family transcriptional regulator, partial [Rugosimonospora sp.]|nr:XRE family transcriptional regulator [Rugosimonospora sp.]